MSTTYLHRCTDIVAVELMPENNNSIKLRITHGGAETELVLFGLPEETTTAILDAIGKKPPADFRDDQDETIRRPFATPRDPDAREEWEI